MRLGSPWLYLSCMPMLVGCTTPMFTMPPGPPEYRTGFHDGCDDGYAYAGSPFYTLRESAEPPPSDELYAAGWQAGFEQCKGNYWRIRRTVSIVLGPP